MTTLTRKIIRRNFERAAIRTCVLLLALGTGCETNPIPEPSNNADIIQLPDGTLPAESTRVAFQSQCAQNVIECTSSWPVAVAHVESKPDQSITETAEGFLIQDTDGDGFENVCLVGSDSQLGDGADFLFYSWSFGANDSDPRTLQPGTEFSQQADPQVPMQVGLHYIRLTVRNDIVRETIESPEFGIIAEDTASFDFVELQIEIREAP